MAIFREHDHRQTVGLVSQVSILIGILTLGIACGGTRPPASHSATSVDAAVRKARTAIDHDDDRKAYRVLVAAASRAHSASPLQRLDLAEALLEVGDYRRAGNLVLGLLEESSRSPVEGWVPDPSTEQRILMVLGKVSFFVSRAPLGPESAEERAARLSSLERAEQVFRELQRGDGRYSGAASYHLAGVLVAQGRFEEAADTLDAYFAGASPGVRPPGVGLRRECAAQLRAGAGDESSGSTGPLNPIESDVSAPVKVRAPAPQYTEAARQTRLQGLVVMHSIIDSSGVPVCLRPLKALPLGLTEAAVEAVFGWRFEPARSKGEPVPVHYHLTINFRLR